MSDTIKWSLPEARGTQQQLPSALSLIGTLIFVAQAALASGVQNSALGWNAQQTLSTGSHVERLSSITDEEILGAIARLHDRLLASSAELSMEARQVLYTNLWQFYE